MYIHIYMYVYISMYIYMYVYICKWRVLPDCGFNLDFIFVPKQFSLLLLFSVFVSSCE